MAAGPERFPAQSFPPALGVQMFKNVRVQMIAMLAIGSLLGFAAASGKLNPFQRADAAPPGRPTAVEKTGASQSGDGSACCEEDAKKAQLLAMADPKAQTAAARAQAPGKKPNILF